jgi:TusA-related sulfurtransferase
MMPKIFQSKTISRKSIWLRTLLALVGTSVAIGVEWQSPKLHSFSWPISPLVVSAQEGSIAGVSNKEILEYARVAYNIEQHRRLVYNEIEKMTDGDVPELACNDEESLENVDSAIRQQFQNWCERSEQIIKDSNLSISRFNKIHELQKENDKLKQRIQQEVQKLREEEENANEE